MCVKQHAFSDCDRGRSVCVEDIHCLSVKAVTVIITKDPMDSLTHTHTHIRTPLVYNYGLHSKIQLSTLSHTTPEPYRHVFTCKTHLKINSAVQVLVQKNGSKLACSSYVFF